MCVDSETETAATVAGPRVTAKKRGNMKAPRLLVRLTQEDRTWGSDR